MTADQRRLLWPALMTTAMMIVLLGLGTWQVQRLFWKLSLLAEIDGAEAAPAVPLGQSPIAFAKVSVTGTFLPDQAAWYGAEVRTIATGPAMGARMIVPLRQTSGGVILVDRGWVPLSRPEAMDEAAGDATVTGYVRYGDQPGWFSARDDLSARRFYTLDPKAIGTAVGQPNVAPFVLVALAAPAPSGRTGEHWPDPARQLPRPPNNHLSYAITWYGLAAALLAIFIVWANKGRRA